MMEKVLVPKRPTVLEIARRANVSQAAVSTVLNAAKSSTIGVSAKTREKILQVAGEVGYVRNELARSLATGKTHTIGILVQTITTNFYAEFFKHIEKACYDNGYSVLIASCEFDREREVRNLQTFLSRRVDAMVISRQPMMHDDLIRKIISQGVPVIIHGEMRHIPYPLVGFNEPEVANLGAGHLWKLGHRRVGYFSAGGVKDTSFEVHIGRVGQFRESWGKVSGGLRLEEFETADAVRGGIDLAKAIINKPRETWPTAIVCSTDRLALSAIAELRKHHVQVPQDISIIGCDDITEAAEGIVPLTTVRLPTDKLAFEIWTLLDKKLQDPVKAARIGDAERILIAPELIVRESTRSIISG